jgi:hypothetical protein
MEGLPVVPRLLVDMSDRLERRESIWSASINVTRRGKAFPVGTSSRQQIGTRIQDSSLSACRPSISIWFVVQSLVFTLQLRQRGRVWRTQPIARAGV